jgi:hypothetical protein
MMPNVSDFSVTEQALLLATYFRGVHPTDHVFKSNSDQILTLSLFYTGDISSDECVARLSSRHYLNQSLYNGNSGLSEEIAIRYRVLIDLLTSHSNLIEGRGLFRLPADPTFTSCRLTPAGFQLAEQLVTLFPQKPDILRRPGQLGLPQE